MTEADEQVSFFNAIVTESDDQEVSCRYSVFATDLCLRVESMRIHCDVLIRVHVTYEDLYTCIYRSCIYYFIV
jgi:hypothetical protein